MRAASAVLTAFLYCFSLAGSGQQSAPPLPITPPAGAVTPPPAVDRHISLDVVVADKSGKPVPGLQQQDFTLLDDKQPQKTLSFRETDLATDEPSDAADPAVQLILFVDAVNTSFHNVSFERQQIDKFLQQSGGRVLTSSNDITKSLAICVADAKVFYTLSFDSPPADHPDEYHSLQVKIAKPGLTARTRTGYYAQREQH